MLKAVLDTNILVSGLIRNGNPRLIWNFVLDGNLQLVLSRQILDEFVKVISRKKFSKYITENEVKAFLETIKDVGNFIEVRHKFKVIKDDPSDDAVVNTAYDAKADYIISGDKHLLKLRKFRRIKIVTASRMIEILRKSLS